MNKSFGECLKAIRLSRGMSQEEFANLLNTSKQVISRYESSKRAPKVTRAQEYAEKLGVPMSALLGNAQQKLVPVLGTVQCGPNGLAEEEPDGYEPADVQNVDEYFYLRAKGDSMEPYIREGDYVLAHKQEDIESGELAVVVVGGEEGTLKKVLKQSNSVILQPFNNNCPTRVFVGKECDDVRVIGKVVETKHKW